MYRFRLLFKNFFILSLIGFLILSLWPLENKNFVSENNPLDIIGVAMASDQQTSRVFRVKEVLDGEWSEPNIEIFFKKGNSGISVIGIDKYSPPPKPKNPEAIQMVLAFQMALGKTRKDFERFKRLDAPWVVSNNGSNAATLWTQRTETWVFDAFEDVTFASKTDFERAYSGNDDLIKAGEGLFGSKVLVVIVEEN